MGISNARMRSHCGLLTRQALVKNNKYYKNLLKKNFTIWHVVIKDNDLL